MRGFPLFNTLLVIALFAVAWWPLRRTVAHHQDAETELNLEGIEASKAPELEAQQPVVLRFVSTELLESIRIEHLGEVVFEGKNDSEFVHEIANLPIPKDGIDLWIDATSQDTETGRTALGVELETHSGDLIERTLWSDDGIFSDSIYLVLEKP